MKFFIFGHPNISSSHKTTLEFAKDKELTKRGTCIVGVKADFSLQEIQKLLKSRKIKIIIEKEEIIADTNPEFNDKKEIVIRKTDFKSERTLGINANKAAVNLSRKLIEKLKNPKEKVTVEIKPMR